MRGGGRRGVLLAALAAAVLPGRRAAAAARVGAGPAAGWGPWFEALAVRRARPAE